MSAARVLRGRLIADIVRHRVSSVGDWLGWR